MKIKLLGLAALALAAIGFVPAQAQEKASRKVLLKEKHEAGVTITDKSTESRDGKIVLNMGGEDQEGAEVIKKAEETTTEVLAVNDGGEITDGRVTQVKDSTTKSSQGIGEAEMGPEQTTVGDMEGVVIRYTWNADSKGFKATLEKGEGVKDSKDVLKALRKKQPFKVPFMPGKEVAVGESWEVPEQVLREFFDEDEDHKILEAKATCKLEGVETTKGGDFAKVSMEISFKGNFNDDNLGELTVEAKITGHYLFDLKQQRITRVETKTTMGFEKEVQTPQGKFKVSYKATGNEVKELTYTKKEGK